MKDFIAAQFRKPKGFAGFIISKLMEKGNMKAYLCLLEKMNLKGKESLFEIGYGPGKGMNHVLGNTKCTVDGIDFSELMFKRCGKINRKHIASARSVIQHGDFTLGFKNNKKYDIIYFVNVIYFWDDLPGTFKKMKKILKTNGKICFYMTEKEDLLKIGFTASDNFNKYSSSDVLASLKTCGFKKVSVEYETINSLKGCFFKITA
jgi:SAM-dependent methyltransferase